MKTASSSRLHEAEKKPQTEMGNCEKIMTTIYNKCVEWLVSPVIIIFGLKNAILLF